MSAPLSEKGYAARESASGWWSTQIDELEKTPELQWPRSVGVFHAMRTDPQVTSVLRAVTLPILRTEWTLDATGVDPAVAEFVSRDLGIPIKGAQQAAAPQRLRGRFSWPQHLRLALLSLTYGHAVFEQVYRLGDDGLLHLRKLGYRPPSTIKSFEVARDGGLVAVHQQGAVGDDAVRIPVEDLVVYVQDLEGSNWQGRSLLRSAYKMWLLKDLALRIQSGTLDRNGLGVPTYTAGPTPEADSVEEVKALQDAEIAAGLKIATELRSGSQSGAAVRNGAKLELLGVSGTLPDADKPIRYYDEQIARAVLAHFLNLGTETGSWALGSTFAEFFSGSLNAVALQVADTVNAHVIEDLVDLNFGESVPAPRLTFAEIGGGWTAEALKALIDAKAIFPDRALEEYVRDHLGLPAKDPATSTAPTGGTA